MGKISPKPPWLRVRFPSGPQYEQTRRLLQQGRLHTVCQEACCPNMFECFSQHTATFLILGEHCTRNCSFCTVKHGVPQPPDPDEPQRVADAAADLNLTYVVVTSVTRDDLPDGGAGHFGATIHALRERNPDVRVEVLIPDFKGDPHALQKVLEVRPDVLNHNIETVPRLYPTVRPQADYRQSLRLLESSARQAPHVPTKSGLMLGLGEGEQEIEATLADLRRAHCRLLTLGQYLQPGPQNHPVVRYVSPEEFSRWRDVALAMEFEEVAAGPFVRSSYQAERSFCTVTAKATE
ncbi:MAG: lipoyl synthase [Desulfobacteraceae bacterium]|nr:MAG: lipoyl synthase [Desulfobacteraceae bacterium]